MQNVNQNKVLKLYANCIVVKGYKRSIICDLQNNLFEYIPNSLATILDRCVNFSLHKILTTYSNNIEEIKILNDYITFLLDKNFAFLCDGDEVDFFPNMDKKIEDPSIISNGIIEIGNSNEYQHDYENIFEQFQQLGTKYLMIRSYINREESFWTSILSNLENSTITSVEIVTPYSDSIAKKAVLTSLIKKNSRIRIITLTSSPKKKQSIIETCLINYLYKKIESANSCGCILPSNFRINKELFFESMSFNNCLNKKISIDYNGYIKNCPSMINNYGHISTISFKDVIDLSIFKKYWKISKAQIDVCNVCEFRYICTDCRAFIQDKKNIKSKPLKCNYDPINAIWN